MENNNKFNLAIFPLFAIVNLIDFVFYGQHIYNISGAIGFVLLAYSSYKSSLLISIAGTVLALGSIAAKYIQ